MADSLATGPRTLLRNWHKRRDRYSIAHWPAPEVPAHWLQVEPTDSRRESYAVALRPEAVLIGRITLRDEAADGATLGIYLHPDYAHRGFGSEALNIFCDYVFDSLGLAQLRIDVAIDNAAALGCYRKCGFTCLQHYERNDHTYARLVRWKGAACIRLNYS